LEECGPCPDLASYTLALALQLRRTVHIVRIALKNIMLNNWDFVDLILFYLST
jgi:hypothetical protein